MTSSAINSSLLSALQYLNGIQSQVTTYQNQVASGLAVAAPADNPAVWAAATEASAEAASVDDLADSLTYASSVTSVADNGLETVLTALGKMASDVLSAQQSGANVASAEDDILAQQQTLISTISASSFDGVNLLDGSTTNPTFTTAFYEVTPSQYSFATTTLNTADTVLTQSHAAGGLLGAATGASTASGTAGSANGAGGDYSATSLLGFSVSSGTSTNDLQTLLSAIDAAITNVTTGATTVGAMQSQVKAETTFAASLSSALSSAAASLVDADMNVASTKLQALQTQEQLSIQALSIANANSALVLRLFGIT